MRTALILAGLLVSLAAQPQDIYKWVDRDGIVHYSDQPGPGSTLVKLEGLNTYESPGVTAGASDPQERSQAQAGVPYRSLRITSPEADASFFGAGVNVTAQADVRGDLQPGHSAVFFLDGNRIPTSDSFTAQMNGLERGTHFLRAAVLDATGQPLITSEQINFFVRMPSVLSPQSSQSPQSPLSPRAQPPPPGS